MNERIRELAKQSGLEIPSDTEFNGHIHRNALEKFANLIIKDCLAMCLTSVGNRDYNTGRMHCHDNIKEHFGIK